MKTNTFAIMMIQNALCIFLITGLNAQDIQGIVFHEQISP